MEDDELVVEVETSGIVDAGYGDLEHMTEIDDIDPYEITVTGRKNACEIDIISLSTVLRTGLVMSMSGRAGTTVLDHRLEDDIKRPPASVFGEMNLSLTTKETLTQMIEYCSDNDPDYKTEALLAVRGNRSAGEELAPRQMGFEGLRANPGRRQSKGDAAWFAKFGASDWE